MNEKQSVELAVVLCKYFKEGDWLKIFKLCGKGSSLQRSDLIKSVHWHNEDEEAQCIYAVEYLIEQCEDDFISQLKNNSYIMEKIKKEIPNIFDEINESREPEWPEIPNENKNARTMGELISKIQETIVEVAMGRSHPDDKNQEYKLLYKELDEKYKARGLVNPNNLTDLWEFKSLWKKNNWGYEERRDFIIKLYKPKKTKPEDTEMTNNLKTQAKHNNIKTNKVFVVHGSNELAKATTENFLRSLDLIPIILHKQVNVGRTLIEKFEHHSEEVDYAVIIMTPDDEGRKKGEHDFKDRARQNVIMELGYFFGKLGRQRVCVLKNETVEEVPSDILGLVYCEMDAAGAWKTRLANELKNAGFEINSEKLLDACQ